MMALIIIDMLLFPLVDTLSFVMMFCLGVSTDVLFAAADSRTVSISCVGNNWDLWRLMAGWRQQWR